MIVLEHRTLYDYADSHHGIMVRWQDKLSRRIALLSRLQREIFARRKRENIMTTTMMFYQAMKIKKKTRVVLVMQIEFFMPLVHQLERIFSYEERASRSE